MRFCCLYGGIPPGLVLMILSFRNYQALDKIRFLSLTDKEVLGGGDDAKLEIQVSLKHFFCSYDPEKAVISWFNMTQLIEF